MSDYRHHAERFDVPGGWIYYGGPLPSPVYVADPSQWAHAPATTSPPDPRLDQVLSLLQQLRQDIQTMSGTLSDKLDAATAAVETDVATVSAEVSQLLASMTPGSQITQAQIDRITAIDTAMKAIPPATPVVIPAPAA